MNTILSALLSVFLFNGTSATVMHDGSDPVQITISAKDSGEEILVNVSTDTDGKVTLSVFSENGEIVVDEQLTPGGNRIKVRHLRPGQYVAVVRHNDEFRQKQEFKVN